jgi:hypothetical protein
VGASVLDPARRVCRRFPTTERALGGSPAPRRSSPLGAAPTRAATTQETTMGTTSSTPQGQAGQEQREALAESEKHANENQYREENNDDKIVEIPPEKDKHPIGGLDPK